MGKKRSSLEEAILQKIENNEGYVYQILILAEDYGASIERIDRILKKHQIKNKITSHGYKFIIKDK